MNYIYLLIIRHVSSLNLYKKIYVFIYVFILDIFSNYIIVSFYNIILFTFSIIFFCSFSMYYYANAVMETIYTELLSEVHLSI